MRADEAESALEDEREAKAEYITFEAFAKLRKLRDAAIEDNEKLPQQLQDAEASKAEAIRAEDISQKAQRAGKQLQQEIPKAEILPEPSYSEVLQTENELPRTAAELSASLAAERRANIMKGPTPSPLLRHGTLFDCLTSRRRDFSTELEMQEREMVIRREQRERFRASQLDINTAPPNNSISMENPEFTLSPAQAPAQVNTDPTIPQYAQSPTSPSQSILKRKAESSETYDGQNKSSKSTPTSQKSKLL